MSETAPITTQPVNSDREQDEESKTERQDKRKTCWQRFSAPFRKCYGNMIDCLDFWCCRNECYDFCCNYNDVEDDEREVAYIRDVEVVDDQAALTDMSSHNNKAHSGDVGISETKLHRDHHLGDQTSGHHNTGNVNKLLHDNNHGDEREVAYISDVEVVYDQVALTDMSSNREAHRGDFGISENKLHGDHYLEDKLSGHHHTGNVNHGGDRSGGHHSGGHHHGGDHSGGDHHGEHHTGGHHHGGDHSGGDHHGEHHTGGHHHGGDHHGGHHSGGHHHGGDYSGGDDSGGGDYGGGDSGGGDCGGGGGDD